MSDIAGCGLVFHFADFVLLKPHSIGLRRGREGGPWRKGIVNRDGYVGVMCEDVFNQDDNLLQ